MIKSRHLTWAVALSILFFSNIFFLNAQSELPAGTKVRVRMENGIDSASAGKDDTFTAVTIKPVSVDGVPIVPIGSVFVGRIISAKPAGLAGKHGKMKVVIERLRLKSGSERNVEGVIAKDLHIKRSGVLSAVAILGGTAIGGLIGLLTKRGKGGAIGAGVGAGAGTGIALSRKGKNVGIGSNEEFEIKLTKAVKLPTDAF